MLISLAVSTILANLVPLACASHVGKTRLAGYWGQSSANNAQDSLATYCDSEPFDIIMISFLNEFPNWGLNLANVGSANYASQGNSLQKVGDDIKKCQESGKIILLSLGGAAGDYKLQNDKEAVEFASTLWKTFGPKTDDTVKRPFGDAYVNGFDFDIEVPWDDMNAKRGDLKSYAALGNLLRELTDAATKSKRDKFYLSAAPQCVYPDAALNHFMTNVALDFVFVQFYNNKDVCNFNEDDFNWQLWQKFASSHVPNRDVKIFIGLPGNPDSAGNGYTPSEDVRKKLMDEKFAYQNFGGISLWDAASSVANKDLVGENYAKNMSSILVDFNKAHRLDSENEIGKNQQQPVANHKSKFIQNAPTSHLSKEGNGFISTEERLEIGLPKPVNNANKPMSGKPQIRTSNEQSPVGAIPGRHPESDGLFAAGSSSQKGSGLNVERGSSKNIYSQTKVPGRGHVDRKVKVPGENPNGGSADGSHQPGSRNAIYGKPDTSHSGSMAGQVESKPAQGSSGSTPKSGDTPGLIVNIATSQRGLGHEPKNLNRKSGQNKFEVSAKAKADWNLDVPKGNIGGGSRFGEQILGKGAKIIGTPKTDADQQGNTVDVGRNEPMVPQSIRRRPGTIIQNSIVEVAGNTNLDIKLVNGQHIKSSHGNPVQIPHGGSVGKHQNNEEIDEAGNLKQTAKLDKKPTANMGENQVVIDAQIYSNQGPKSLKGLNAGSSKVVNPEVANHKVATPDQSRNPVFIGPPVVDGLPVAASKPNESGQSHKISSNIDETNRVGSHQAVNEKETLREVKKASVSPPQKGKGDETPAKVKKAIVIPPQKGKGDETPAKDKMGGPSKEQVAACPPGPVVTLWADQPLPDVL